MLIPKRAQRRCQRAAKIRHAQRVASLWGIGPIELQRWTVRNYNHLKSCSCYLCGHRRRWEGATMQERRFEAGEEMV